MQGKINRCRTVWVPAFHLLKRPLEMQSSKGLECVYSSLMRLAKDLCRETLDQLVS